MIQRQTFISGCLVGLSLLLFPFLGFSQDIIQGGDPPTLQACVDFFDGDTYTDSGGAAGDYSNNEDEVL
jgi:hypothetical protein